MEDFFKTGLSKSYATNLVHLGKTLRSHLGGSEHKNPELRVQALHNNQLCRLGMAIVLALFADPPVVKGNCDIWRESIGWLQKNMQGQDQEIFSKYSTIYCKC
jgi:hypothetical protein